MRHLFRFGKHLNDFFPSQSQAQKMKYKLQLQTIKKGGSTIAKYLLKIKDITKPLASAGHIVP